MDYAATRRRIDYLISNYTVVQKHNTSHHKDRSFALISGSQQKPDPFYISDMNVSFSGSRIRRETEYCQWTCHRMKDRTCDGGYSRIWSRTLIDSSDFDTPYQNPSVREIPLIDNVQPIRLGAYTIDEFFVRRAKLSRLPYLLPEQVAAFQGSNLSATFQYRANGYLYSQYPLRQYNSHYRRLSASGTDCIVGSVRLEFYVFDPEKITVFGGLDGTRIIETDLHGTTIAFIRAGRKTITDLLLPMYNRARRATIWPMILVLGLSTGWNILHWGWYGLIATFGHIFLWAWTVACFSPNEMPPAVVVTIMAFWCLGIRCFFT
jgi:hypothetical protein